MDTPVRDPVIDALFAAVPGEGYLLKSDPTPSYNCIAWAASVTTIPWWPTPFPLPGVYWPIGVPRRETLDAFMMAYGTIGYIDCGMDASLEQEFEKIAIYVTVWDNKPKHAARQLRDGLWTSKLGPYRDIHHTASALEHSLVPGTLQDYGRVVKYMKRRRDPAHLCLREPGVMDAAA